MHSVTKSGLFEQSGAMSQLILHRFEYLHHGFLNEDLDYLLSIHEGHSIYDSKRVHESIRRVKEGYFHVPYQADLIIPESFYKTPIGTLILSIELAIPAQKNMTVQEIAEDLQWSRQWVHKNLYNVEDLELKENQKAGKIPAIKTTIGYLIHAARYQEWKQLHYLKKTRRRKRYG
jgi:hypothetical protein